MGWWRRHAQSALFIASTILLAVGAIGWLLGSGTVATIAWITGAVLGLVVSVAQLVAAIRQGRFSVDVIAVLALAGALVVGEPFAGAMITVMLASGQLLEARADARARRELGLLVGRAPRTARRAWPAGSSRWRWTTSPWATACSSARVRSSPSMVGWPRRGSSTSPR